MSYERNLTQLIVEDTDRLQIIDTWLASLHGDVSVVAVYSTDKEPTYLKNIEEARAAFQQYAVYVRRRIREHEERLGEVKI